MARQASNSPAKKKASPKATIGAPTKAPTKAIVTPMLTTPGSGGRRAFVSRATKETRISAAINLDGTGKYDINTGIGFLDHMLEQLSRHSLIDITLRADGDLPDDPVVHACIVTYASDMTLLDTTVLPFGLAWDSPGMQMASLDHAMWFHRPFRADEWLLYAQETPSASGGRGTATGSIYTHDGHLAVTVVQEGLIRVSR